MGSRLAQLRRIRADGAVPPDGAGSNALVLECAMEMSKVERGHVLERLFRENPDLPIKPFLAHIEQKAKREGDLEILREIRAYRQAHDL